jgi:hypothetical protein
MINIKETQIYIYTQRPSKSGTFVPAMQLYVPPVVLCFHFLMDSHWIILLGEGKTMAKSIQAEY